MSFKELVLKNRSCRRFKQDIPVSHDQLLELIDVARCCPSAANRQPLKYFLSSDTATNNMIFASLRWAAALKDWYGPAPGERPAAYILILLDKRVAADPCCDHAIAAQTMRLAAAEAGLAGCILGAIDRDALRETLAIPDHLDVLLAVALGIANETVVLESVPETGSTDYYRDSNGVHHVPKRERDDLIVTFQQTTEGEKP